MRFLYIQIRKFSRGAAIAAIQSLRHSWLSLTASKKFGSKVRHRRQNNDAKIP